MPTLNFSPEFLAKYGGSVTGFETLLDGLLTKVQALVDDKTGVTAELQSVDNGMDTLLKKVSNHDGEIAALKTTIAALPTPASMLEAAKQAGSEQAAIALGKAGSQTPVRADIPKMPTDNAEAKVEYHNGRGEYGEAWDNSKALQDEFPTRDGYSAYMRAKAEGRVGIPKRK
jgi:hypothetical protein